MSTLIDNLPPANSFTCPKCQLVGTRHRFFNECTACVTSRLSRAGHATAAKRPGRAIDPTKRAARAEATKAVEKTVQAVTAPRPAHFAEMTESLTLAISNGKTKFTAVRRFDVYRETATGMYFPRGIGRYGQVEGMRPVLRLQQLGTGEWRETPLTAIGSEVGS